MEERTEEFLEKLIRLDQERNTQFLSFLAVLRDMAVDIHQIAASLPQPPGQLKNLSTIFELPK